MSIHKVAVIFDNTGRPETTGLYCRRALGQLVEVEHFRPSELERVPATGFDLYLNVDDGLKYAWRGDLHPSAFWAIDTHIDLERVIQHAQGFDHVFAAQRNGAEELRKAGLATATWLPLACDPAIHRPHDVPLQYDVAFVGNLFRGPRSDLLAAIRERFPRTFVGRRYFEQMAQVYSAARLVFNRSVADDLNMRVFEALGCGACLLTNDLAENGQAELLEPGRQLVTYADQEDLLEKLAWYLAHDDERARVAAEGRAEVLARHTYLHRMSTLLRTVERRTARTQVAGISIAPDQPATAERTVSAVLLAWKRPDNMRTIVSHLLHEPLIDDILVWNNNPEVQYEFGNPRVRVIQSPVNVLTYGRYACLGNVRHDVVYVQDDDCLVHNIQALHEAFELGDRQQLTCNLKLDHLINAPRMTFGTAQLALVGWGALFRREWGSVLDDYRAAYGPDELRHREADRIFSVLLNRRHRFLPADVTDLPGAEGSEALSVDPQHAEFTRAAICRALALLQGSPPARNPEPSTRTTSGRSAADKEPFYFEFDRPEVRDLVPLSAGRILDVGCGSGRLGAALQARQECDVVGIEMDGRAASNARQVLADVVEADIERGEVVFAEERFDCVVCADVLEHLRDPAAVLRNVRRWLAPDGSLVLSVPNVRNHTVIQSLLAGNWTYESAGLLDEDHVRFFTRRELEKLLFRCGFEIEELRMAPGDGFDQWVQSGRSRTVSVGGLQVRAASTQDAQEYFAYQWLIRARPAPASACGLTSIIIVTHNQLAYTRQCVDSIRLRTDEPYELVFVDNGSTDGTPEYLRSLGDVTVVVNDTNRGFPAAVNQGLQAARGNHLLLLNNDTVVTTGWLRRLLDALHADPQLGLVGPVSNNVSGEQCIEAGYGQLNELDGWAWDRQRSAQCGEPPAIVPTDRLVGFCLLIKRRVLDEIGLLDERFGIGCFEDDDFCRRALAAGWGCAIVPTAFVHHFGSATFRGSGVDLGDVLRRNQQAYDQKWNGNGHSNGADGCSDQTNGQSVRERDDDRLIAPDPQVPGRRRPQFMIERDAAEDLLLQPNTLKLSVCLIVRDNERTIRPCLESVRPWVDEMVVVDTGSVDRTPEICRELGARVFHWPWRDDFAAARNVSLDQARGEWVFWMDSDDTIPVECGRRLRKLVDGPHAGEMMGYVLQVHCPGKNSDDLTVVDHVKLFRNRPDLRFEFRIHEQILPSIRRANGDVAFTEIFVVHSGADHTAEGRAHKLQRDFRLLELELRERPEHPFVLFNLGMTYADAGQHREAVEHLQRCIAVSQPQESHLRKAYALLVAALQQLQHYPQAHAVCWRGLELFPDDKELLFRDAMLLHQAGRLEEAAATYERLLAEPTDRHFSSLDAGIAGDKARHNLAIVYEEMGRIDLADEQRRLIPPVSRQALWARAPALHQPNVPRRGRHLAERGW